MHSFQTILGFVNKTIYAPSKLVVTHIKEETQNSEYAAGTFTLRSESAIKTVRFRAAKITPTKVGQFVTFWQKNASGVNQSYHYDDVPDLLVITVFGEGSLFGQFVIPKKVLLKQNIVRSDTTKGKMAIRVYPSWDIPTNKVAEKTQKWQLEYFFTVTNIDEITTEKMLALYRQ